MQPREYQLKLITEAREKLRDIQSRLNVAGIKRRPRLMVQAACGAGKTFIASLMAKSAVEKGGRVCFLAHRDFLVEQTSQTFAAQGIDHSFLAAGRWLNPWTPAHVGMIASMKSRMKKITPPTLCFLDEGHHGVAATWKYVMDEWPNTIFILLSATPGARSDRRGLDEVCDDIVLGPSVAELIRLEALSDYRYFSPSTPDLGGVHIRAGDYAIDEIDAEMNKAVIIGDIVHSYRKYAMDTKAIYFATTIDTSKRYAAAFNAAGIRAEHIDADSSTDMRRNVAIAMARGELKVMTNVGIATEGYDLAAQAQMPVTIETVGLCRPTMSLPLLIQMEMRAMRAKSYPGIILDHGGCYQTHNFLPDDDIEWSLAGGKRKEAPPIMLCDGCGAAVPRNTAVCKHCGFRNGEDMLGGAGGGKRPDVEHVDGDLQEVDREAIKKAKKMEEWSCDTFEQLVGLGKRRGYSNPEGWAGHLWTVRERARKEKADRRIGGQMQFFEALGR